MASFDSQMDGLLERAVKANERVQDSLGATKEKLESQVTAARASIEKTNRQLREKARPSEPSKRWSEAMQTWNAHTAEIRRTADAPSRGGLGVYGDAVQERDAAATRASACRGGEPTAPLPGSSQSG